MRYQPDTVLFEKTKPGIPEDMIEMLGAETWDVRIIELSLEDNKISLYHREHQTVLRAGDLLQFVLG